MAINGSLLLGICIAVDLRNGSNVQLKCNLVDVAQMKFYRLVRFLHSFFFVSLSCFDRTLFVSRPQTIRVRSY